MLTVNRIGREHGDKRKGILGGRCSVQRPGSKEKLESSPECHGVEDP